MKYVLKKIFIGFSIGFLLMLIRSNVHAQVYTGTTGGKTVTVSTYSNDVDFTLPNQLFNGLGHGYVYFSFGTQKVLGSNGATSEILIPRQAFLSNGANTTNYVCNIGSSNVNNSTYEGGIYSVECPFNADNSGLGYIHVRFMNKDANSQSNYYVVIGGPISFVSDSTNFLGSINSNISSIDNRLATVNSNFDIIGQQQRDVKNAINSSSTATTNAINGTTTAIQQSTTTINNTLTSDDVSTPTTTGSNFFSGFTSNSHGLSGIITAPLRLTNALTTATCSPLEFNLPFVHNHVVLSCMRPIYTSYFGSFFTFYQLLTSGVLCYMIMINLFSKLHDLQNPNNDRIAVLNL